MVILGGPVKILLLQKKMKPNIGLRMSNRSLRYSLKDVLYLKLQFPQHMYSFGHFN